MRVSVVIVGGRGGSNIGDSMFRACQNAGISVSFINHYDAYSSFKPINSLTRIIMDKSPPYLMRFSQMVRKVCVNKKPSVLLTTGISPILARDLCQIKSMGIRCVNYLTDDPWNKAHFSQWFISALAHYDEVFSVRFGNIADIEALRGPRVSYLPFGYDHELFYRESMSVAAYKSDVLFAGGADVDREPYLRELIDAGIKTRIYGSYWGRYKSTRSIASGQTDVATVRRAMRAAKIVLCLVRRANRDDNCMRSFEAPAVGACMLAEDTEGHRKIFGAEGLAVLYFKKPQDMLEKTHYLLTREDERLRLAEEAHRVITTGKNTYRDRLLSILGQKATNCSI